MLFARITLGLTVFLCLGTAISAEAETPAPEESLSLQAESIRREVEEPLIEIGEEPQLVSEISETPEPVKKAGPPIFVNHIIVEGNTVFDTAVLRKMVQGYENRQTELYELERLAHAITRLYISAGYLTSQAYLPPQKIKDGIITIRIIEGKIGNIAVEGNRYFSEDFYKSYFEYGPDKNFRLQDFNSSLYFLNKAEDADVKAYLVPGSEAGYSDIVLKTEETPPFHMYYEWHNRGTNLTHHSRHVIHIDHSNLTGNGDILRSGMILSEEGSLDGGYILYEVPFNHHRDVFRLTGSYIKTMLVKHLKPAEIKGNYLSVSPGISHYFIRTPELSLALDMGAEYKDSKTSQNDFKISFDRMRKLFAGPSLEMSDPGGRSVISQKTYWGIPDFWGGSSENDINASRTNTGGEFIYYELSGVRIQRLTDVFYTILRAEGQWTRDSLASSERYSAGGAYSVRGYPESDSSGDYGYNFSSEMHARLPILPKQPVRLYSFLDGARTYDRERNTQTDVKDRFLLGTGIGCRWDLGRNNSADIAWGVPIGDKSNDKNRNQIYFSVKVGF